MKKLVTTLMVPVFVLLITGCKNDKILTCKSREKDIYGYFTIEYLYVLQFDYSGKHLIGYKSEENFIFGSAITNDDKQYSYNQIEEQCNEYNKLSGVVCEWNKNDEYIHTYVKVISSELDKENREKLYADYTYNDWKDWLEEDEYICE